jgi:cold shock CspA family protein
VVENLQNSVFEDAPVPKCQKTASKHSKQVTKESCARVNTVKDQRYQGVVKYFRGSYGWITCAAISRKFDGQDVFVHRMECETPPRQGDTMSFKVVTDASGRPQAMEACFVVGEKPIDAQTWFSRASGRH